MGGQALVTAKGTVVLARLAWWTVVDVTAEAIGREAGNLRRVADERARLAEVELDRLIEAAP